MPPTFGTNVSRTLDPSQRAFVVNVLQQGKPPCDADLNLIGQIAEDWRRILTLRGTPSGFLGNGTNAQNSFVTNPNWSNWLQFGQQASGETQAIEWAVVNGWLIPVTGTLTGTPPGSPDDVSTWNKVTFDPPPANSGDARIDFAFLEVWQARVAPNPSTTNKPSASGIYRYGNVEGGMSFIADDLKDPTIALETTQRIQLQYRIRVVPGLIGLASYPDGFDPSVVKARGAASTVTSFTFQNMRSTLGDAGLWRAGDGSVNALGTIDGYSYAIPICAVFRRNSVTWDGDPSQNLNGGFNRNPTAVDRTGVKTFSTTPTLGANMTASALTLTLASGTNIPLPATPASPVMIQIGDEYMTYITITGTSMTLQARGQLGSRAEVHKTGAVIRPVAGRPDGLFADQIAKTDILDLRHAINPNGFDTETLLQQNLDKLLRGELRANWKRSGGGPQGSFVTYQDKVSNSPAAMGVTKLDGPDGIRTIFSDAAAIQPIEIVLTPPAGTGGSQPVSTSWGLSLTATAAAGTAGSFATGDVITIPVAQLKTGLIGADADQIRWLGGADGDLDQVVAMRIDGNAFPLREGVDFTITASPTSSTDLQITLTGSGAWPTTRRLYVTAHVLYGPGRGMSRRPDAIHSVAALSMGSDNLTSLAGVPADNVPMRTAWAPLWSKYRGTPFNNLLPVTAEAYADPGSKTLILTPFRRVDMPDVMRTLDGSSVNPNTGVTVASGSTGSATNTTTFTDAGGTFTVSGVVAGDALIITSPAGSSGTYIVQSAGTTTLVADRPIPTGSSMVYTIHHTQGLMPLLDRSGGAKWGTTDPLSLFRGTTFGTAATKNIFLPLPRRMVPGWGEVRLPILHTDTATFSEGVNFLVRTTKGSLAAKGAGERNFVPMSNGGLSYASFSTLNLTTTSTAATYNAAFSYSGNSYAGMRFFTDSRGLGRTGLELPPFYGIARLFAVYEAADYKTSGPAYDATTRNAQAGATNLLRQNFDGPVFWIEIDADGDSTFILNAEAIDITRSPNAIANFAAGHYVIDANIFGFDRGSFALDQQFRLVMTRESTSYPDATQAGSGTRGNNYGTGTDADILSPDLVVPGPAGTSDEVAINYSRTPYQGDAWGSQTTFQDIAYTPGSLLSGTAFQISGSPLGLNLTRPNQKPLEVLGSVAFATTLGTGRFAGDFGGGNDFRNVGFEVATSYPPASGIAARPAQSVGALVAGEGGGFSLGTNYHGCTERLPLGALYRDKDFRGGYVGGFGDPNFAVNQFAPLVMVKDRAPGLFAAGVFTGATGGLEQTQVPCQTASVASGQAGEVVVHVDGETGSYSLLTNFRTARGGSLFSATAPRPGGEFQSSVMQAGPHAGMGRVLTGVAMLVRNVPTNVSSTEVSAGGELMLVIVTTVNQLDASTGKILSCSIGTNGTSEGYSAADIYRIEGHPLVKDNVRSAINPATIALTPRI